MLINPEVRKCVVFLGCDSPDGAVYGGTAFSVVYPWEQAPNLGTGYFVTTNHSLKQIAQAGYYEALIRLNKTGGGVKILRTKVSDWVTHPTDSTVDVAIYPYDADDERELLSFPIIPTNLAAPLANAYNGFNLGDPVFFPGLFKPYKGESRNIPIVRSGMISSMSEERVLAEIGKNDKKLIEAYLVETRSIGGLSGSPVFLYFDGKTRYGVQTSRTAFYLLGMMQGHYDARLPVSDSIFDDSAEKVNMGIGIVVPVEKIIEVLKCEELTQRRDNEEQQYIAEHQNEAASFPPAPI